MGTHNNRKRLSFTILITLVCTGLMVLSRCNSPSVKKKSKPQKQSVHQQAGDPTNGIRYQAHQADITLHYSTAFSQYRSAVADTQGWSNSSMQKGQLALQLKLPRSFQPKTNFIAAFFTAGWNDDPQVRAHCLEAPQAGWMSKKTTVVINGVKYVMYRYGDAGAGNYYDISQYRAVRRQRCYSFDLMVHYMNIHNYPADRGITAFDSTRVQHVLHAVMQSVKFLN